MSLRRKVDQVSKLSKYNVFWWSLLVMGTLSGIIILEMLASYMVRIANV